LKIACVGYRVWAIDIYQNLKGKLPEHEFLLQLSEADFCELAIAAFKPDLVLFYGWSKIIPTSLVTKYSCLMLHPSPLPKYRGGSPLQNQIIRGETKSAVTIFLIDEGIDTGPIAKQKELDLSGTLSDIFERISNIGLQLTLEIALEGLSVYEQDEEEASYYNRRKPHESEITIDELTNQSSLYLYNKIRMLQDPYPNPFIKTVDGKRIVIKSAVIQG
jgi:methionyl-tRNA formyltransferase